MLTWKLINIRPNRLAHWIPWPKTNILKKKLPKNSNFFFQKFKKIKNKYLKIAITQKLRVVDPQKWGDS